MHGADVAEREQHPRRLARFQTKQPVVGDARVHAGAVDHLAGLGPAGRAGGVDDLVGGRRVGGGAVAGQVGPRVGPSRPGPTGTPAGCFEPSRQLHRRRPGRGRVRRSRWSSSCSSRRQPECSQLEAPLRGRQPRRQAHGHRAGRGAGQDRDQVRRRSSPAAIPTPSPGRSPRLAQRGRGPRDVVRQLRRPCGRAPGRRVDHGHRVRPPVDRQVQHVEHVARPGRGVGQLVPAVPRLPHHPDGVPVVGQVVARGHAADGRRWPGS